MIDEQRLIRGLRQKIDRLYNSVKGTGIKRDSLAFILTTTEAAAYEKVLKYIDKLILDDQNSTSSHTEDSS